MKRARIVVLVAFTSAAIAAAAACSFPEVSFESGGSDGGQDSPTSNEGGPVSEGGSGAGGDSALPKDVDPDGGSQEASLFDANSVVDASGCTTCDCDNDEFARNGGDAGSGGACVGSGDGGYDCDDTIPDINPAAGFVASPVWPSKTTTMQNDWNCDGQVTKQFSYSLNCAGMLAATSNCAALSGFSDDPACGQPGTFVKCGNPTGLGLFCVVASTDTTIKQGCK